MKIKYGVNKQTEELKEGKRKPDTPGEHENRRLRGSRKLWYGIFEVTQLETDGITGNILLLIGY